MKRLYLDAGKTGPAIITPLPAGFGLFIDLRHRAIRFGGYGQALYEFLDYERGEQDPWNWRMLYEVPVNIGAARRYEQWLDTRRRNRNEKHSKIKWPFIYQCWKCPKWHLAERMTAAEARAQRKDYGITIRRITWLGYLMRVGQALLYVQYLKLTRRK